MRNNSFITVLVAAGFVCSCKSTQQMSRLHDVLAESEQTLTFRNQIDEANNDAAQLEFDYQNDLILLNSQKWLFEQIKKLRDVGSASQQEYDENLSILQHLEAHLQETQGRLHEFQSDAKVNAIKLSKARGEEFKVVNLARAYLDLWRARLDKSKGILAQAKIDKDYFALQLVKAQQVIKTNSISQLDLVKAQRDADQSANVFNAAQKVVESNQLHVEEFTNLIKDIESGTPNHLVPNVLR